VNRFDGVIVFKPLTRAEIVEIAKLKLTKLSEYLQESKRLTLTITPDAVARLAELGFDPAFGARPLERVIREKVETAVANALLANPDLTTVTISKDNL
jgi:ATP-dependent Clp protease ATP-binding subunit ClpE